MRWMQKNERPHTPAQANQHFLWFVLVFCCCCFFDRFLFFSFSLRSRTRTTIKRGTLRSDYFSVWSWNWLVSLFFFGDVFVLFYLLEQSTIHMNGCFVSMQWKWYFKLIFRGLNYKWDLIKYSVLICVLRMCVCESETHCLWCMTKKNFWETTIVYAEFLFVHSDTVSVKCFREWKKKLT